MIINLDKFLVKELNDNGIPLTYQQMVSIYRESRKNPECIARKKRKERNEALLLKYSD